MTTETEYRALLEQALEAFQHITKDSTGKSGKQIVQDICAAEAAIRAELAKPVEQAKPVAWMDDFGNVFPIGANKGSGSWMDAHQRSWKPLYLHQPTPTWQDAPEVAALKAERDAATKDAERYRWLRHGDNDEKVLCHGPIDMNYWYLLRNEKLDAAIDAAIAKAEGSTE